MHTYYARENFLHSFTMSIFQNNLNFIELFFISFYFYWNCYIYSQFKKKFFFLNCEFAPPFVRIQSQIYQSFGMRSPRLLVIVLKSLFKWGAFKFSFQNNECVTLFIMKQSFRSFKYKEEPWQKLNFFI